MNVLERDFFTDREILQDPIPYYAALRERDPVWREPHRGVFLLSGIDEILEVYSDPERFSAIVGAARPAGEAAGARRGRAPGRGHRAAPRRDSDERHDHDLRSSQAHPTSRADGQALHAEPAQGERGVHVDPRRRADRRVRRAWTRSSSAARTREPFTLLVIADLLGVPREDHETFRGWLGGAAGQCRRPRRPACLAIRCSRTCIPTSPATSRSAAPRRATT